MCKGQEGRQLCRCTCGTALANKHKFTIFSSFAKNGVHSAPFRWAFRLRFHVLTALSTVNHRQCKQLIINSRDIILRGMAFFRRGGNISLPCLVRSPKGGRGIHE